MLQGICIDTENTVVLTEGAQYFLFPNGTEHYYVSKFPNKGAHTGCFQAKHFKVIENVDVIVELDREKVYFAHLFRKEGYPGLELKGYYIQLRKTHCYIYHDEELTDFKGCFPLEWFRDFEEIVTIPMKNDTETIQNVTEVEEIEYTCMENGQLVLF